MLINLVLVTFDFKFLLEFSMFLSCFTWIFEFLSFVALRHNEPDAPRPFEVPGGLPVAWGISIVKIILVSGLLILLAIEETVVLISAVTFNGIVLCWYCYLLKRNGGQPRQRPVGFQAETEGIFC